MNYIAQIFHTPIGQLTLAKCLLLIGVFFGMVVGVAIIFICILFILDDIIMKYGMRR